VKKTLNLRTERLTELTSAELLSVAGGTAEALTLSACLVSLAQPCAPTFDTVHCPVTS
jgi:hypothetical protein